jgi:hypothetical protein
MTVVQIDKPKHANPADSLASSEVARFWAISRAERATDGIV